MIFTSPEFVVFALAFFLGYTTLPRRWLKAFSLGASYLFYGTWNPKYLLLLMGSTLLDYGASLGIARSQSLAWRRFLLGLSLTFSLGALCFFKYYNFFAESVAAMLAAVGVHVSQPVLETVLPLGISFYTFQTISYTIDVYRRAIQPERSLVDFALYVAYFPQLVAGPIERAKDLLPGVRQIGLGTLRCDWSGLGMIALGAFKKCVIADNLFLVVLSTYTKPEETLAPALWIGTYAFTIMAYCDFSGYSDIALGLSRLMGIELSHNFRSPLAAAGPADFFRRWHVSVANWFRDYLYIPLGGSRRGRVRTLVNLFVTMLLMLIWHGAGVNYLLCGVYVGLLMVVFRLAPLVRLARDIEDGPTRLRVPGMALRRIAYYHIACVGLGLFCARSYVDCKVIFLKLVDFTRWDLPGWLVAVRESGEGLTLAWICLGMIGFVGWQIVWPVDSSAMVDRAWKLPSWARIAFVATLLYLAAIFSPPDPPPFLYFQF